jgi:sugar lactone lactonase YvrE
MYSGARWRGRAAVRRVWNAGARHPETPRWLAAEQRVGFIDGASGEWLRVAADGGRSARESLATELGFLAAAPDGALLYGSGTTIGRVGCAAAWATVPGDAARLRLNDAGFDAAGGLWTGTMDRRGEQPTGMLWRVSAGGGVEAMLDGFTIPNGFALDRGGRTLYVADSPRRVVHALELGDDGRLRARRQFAAGDALCRGYPDGMAVDAEDHLWIAFYDGGCVGRYRPDGSLERRVALPVARVTACAFGGAALDTLFVTAGEGLYAFEPGVTG